MSLKTIVITYLIGGLTLPPLLIVGVLYLMWVLVPKLDGDDQGDDGIDLSDVDEKERLNLRMTELDDKASDGVKAYKSGWITVTREYHTFVSNAAEKQIDAKDSTTKSAYTVLYKYVQKKKQGSKDEDTANGNGQNSNNNSSGTSTPVVTKSVKRKNRFFGVLRHGNLFLYKNDDMKDVQHVIVMAKNIVTMWPRDLTDAELFTKRTAICILRAKPRRQSDVPPRSSAASLSDSELKTSTMDILENGSELATHMGFFIYCDTNYEKEDWYFELIKASKREGMSATGTELDLLDPSVYAEALHFKTADMISLIQTLHSSEGQLHTRWLNAIIGRLYLSLQETDVFENFVEAKLLKKLSKINKPDFLEEFEVKKINIGNAAPFISFPKLQSLNPDGSLRVSFRVTYTGKMSLQIATRASVFPTLMQKRDVLLSVTVNRIDGPLVITMKPPPSNRLWYTFESMPEVDFKIEPVVSQRQLSYSLVTNIIEKKFKDAIKESLVEPSWDDITFFNTSDEFYRGGIWTMRRPKHDHDDVDKVDKETAEDLKLPDADVNDETLDDASSTSNPVISNKSTELPPIIDDDASMRSSKTFGKKSGRLGSLARKKSEASIVTSHEQFLADGSYVSRDILSGETSDSSDGGREKTKSSTMQLLSAETAAGKKAISNSMKRLGKWYSEKNIRGSSGNLSNEKEKNDYTPPEMISRRRAPSSGERPSMRKTSVGDLSIGSAESPYKTAPQAHSFPKEYMYGLDSHAPGSVSETKHSIPTRIPEMTMPKSPPESKFAPISPALAPVVHTRNSVTRRKPVSEDEGIERLAETQEDTPVAGSAAVLLPAFTESEARHSSVPPALPPRDVTTPVKMNAAPLLPPRSNSAASMTQHSEPSVGNETALELLVDKQKDTLIKGEIETEIKSLSSVITNPEPVEPVSSVFTIPSTNTAPEGQAIINVSKEDQRQVSNLLQPTVYLHIC